MAACGVSLAIRNSAAAIFGAQNNTQALNPTVVKPRQERTKREAVTRRMDFPLPKFKIVLRKAVSRLLVESHPGLTHFWRKEKRIAGKQGLSRGTQRGITSPRQLQQR